MKSLIAGTFLADDHTLLLGAVITSGNTVGAGAALLAPSLDLEIAFSAIGAVALALCRAVNAQKSVAKVYRAAITDLRTGLAGSALSTPGHCFNVALVTVGAMRASVDSAFLTDAVAYLEV